MAKGNMLLGMSRGSVGDVTFYRSGGSQRARARNRKPANPMTVLQQTQRSKFANAVKFYKQVTSNFFRFAYEDKKVNESDYNAFMRHNVGNSGFIGAKASKVASWPALGLWEVTNGSLPVIPNLDAGENPKFLFDVGVKSSTYTTIGALSSALIALGDTWREGDIVTVLLYGVSIADGLPTVDTAMDHEASSGYMQFALHSTDSTQLSSLKCTVNGFVFGVSLSNDGLEVTSGNSSFSGSWSGDLYQCAVIHSRNTAGGLLVSTQSMISNKEDVITDALTEGGTYYNAVLADWDAAAKAVLQGGGAAN